MKIHPRGTIPAVDADGLILRDSIGVLAWLDREYPDRPLFGESSTDAAHIWQRVLESSDYLRAAVNDVLFSLLVQGKSVPEEGTSERKVMLASAQKLRDECQLLEEALSDSPFMVGAVPSAADAVCFPEICLIERAVTTKYDDMSVLGLASMETEFPKLEAWKSRVFGQPNVDKTMPSHWARKQING